MKIRVITFIAILALLFAGFAPRAAFAQAYTTSFTTSITYQNVGEATTTLLKLYFFADPTTTSPTSYDLAPLPANAGASLFIGGLDESVVGSGFQGAAYLQSDQPILATLVQLPQGSATVKNRALSNGFSAGAPTALIATVLKNTFDTNTIFSVQNVDTEENTLTIQFYDTSANLVDTVTQDVQPGAAFYVDAGTMSSLGAAFNGSAVVTSERADATDGSIVAGAMELEIVGAGDKAFEGVSTGGQLFYMPSALCNAFGGFNTAYAVQNTSLTDPTDVTVTYTDADGNEYSEGPFEIGAGAKRSFVACNATGMPAGFNGSGVVESTATDIIAIGKAYGLGATTAFNGASMGYEVTATPYVRFATQANYDAGTGQRTFLTIQNVGGAAISGDITVAYVDRDGNVQCTHTFSDGLAVGAKFNSNASLGGAVCDGFGFYPPDNPTAFGGSAVITAPAGSQLAVVARVSTDLGATVVSEDYNGLPVP